MVGVWWCDGQHNCGKTSMSAAPFPQIHWSPMPQISFGTADSIISRYGWFSCPTTITACASTTTLANQTHIHITNSSAPNISHVWCGNDYLCLVMLSPSNRCSMDDCRWWWGSINTISHPPCSSPPHQSLPKIVIAAFSKLSICVD